jgi:RNA polymerase sigma-70 factor, ECF subfamily
LKLRGRSGVLPQWDRAGDSERMTTADRFEVFVRRYQDMVFGTAVRLLGNPIEAEDVAQTVFLRAFERFAAIGESPSAAGWLKTVTTNACLNHLSRYRARWRLFSELASDDETDPFEDTLVADAAAERALEHSERDARVERALRALPDHQRVPLVLFHFEDLSYQDIATLLGVSLGKVKTDIHRGRATLRRQLRPDDDAR